MKFSACFLFPAVLLGLFSFEAKGKSTSSSHWFLFEREGKPIATVKQTIRTDSAKKSITILQSRTLLGGPKGSLETESVSLNNSKLTPSFLSSKLKAADRELHYRVMARSKGRLKEFEVVFDPVKGPGKFDKARVPADIDSVFHSALPVYLSRLESGFYVNYVITEDDAEGANVKSRYTKIQRLTEKKEIGGEQCSRSLLEFGGFAANMWVNPDGILCEFDMPSVKTKVTRTTEAKVKVLLGQAK